MSAHETPSTDRRTFLQSGALVTAAALGSAPASGAREQPAKQVEVPRRTLGKTGLQVTRLEACLAQSAPGNLHGPCRLLLGSGRGG